MVHVNDFDHTVRVKRSTFQPIFLGDKTALIRPDVNGDYNVADVIELTEEDDTTITGRVCEVEITHIDELADGVVLLSITLVA